MKIVFVFVGKTRQGENYMEQGVADYLGRIRRYARAEIRLVAAEQRHRGVDEAKALAKEAERLASALADCDHVICLDEAGRQSTSVELAHLLDGLMLHAVKRTAFVVGGSGGLSAGTKGAAHRLLSLGKMTLTHEMSRLVIIEQVYRALSIRAGEPYHRT
ncbi:MAG: 23S rRNA (pseudouridine(1915)-N(3))-methyltransferase RlmH [Pseudomonadota bacterium]